MFNSEFWIQPYAIQWRFQTVDMLSKFMDAILQIFSTNTSQQNLGSKLKGKGWIKHD